MRKSRISNTSTSRGVLTQNGGMHCLPKASSTRGAHLLLRHPYRWLTASSAIFICARVSTYAVTWAERAVALNPGEAESHAWLANVLSYVGRSAEALEQIAHAIRLDPLYPPLWEFYKGRALLHLGQYEEALASFEVCARRGLSFHWRLHMVAALAQLGSKMRHGRSSLTQRPPEPTGPSVTFAASSRIWRALSLTGFLRACVWQVFLNDVRHRRIRPNGKATRAAEADRCRPCRHGWLQPAYRAG